MHRIRIGTGAIGVAFSLIFGAASPEALARKKAAVKKPLPHPLGL